MLSKKYIKDIDEYFPEDLRLELRPILGEVGDGKLWSIHTKGDEITIRYDESLAGLISDVDMALDAHSQDASIIIRAVNKRKEQAEKALVRKLRKTVSQDKEFGLLREGLLNANNPDFIAYKNQSNSLKGKLSAINAQIDIQANSSTDYKVAVPNIEIVKLEF